jgi:Family of unknown function (DUF5309)
MAVSINTGVVDTEARLSSERVVDMDPSIGLKETDNAQFMTILQKLPSTDATQVEVRWLEDQLLPNRSTLAASATSADSAVGVASGTGVYFRPGDILYVEQTSEKLEVTGVTTDSLGVTRSVGAVAAATAASGGGVVIVGNAAAQGADTGVLKSTDRALGFNYTQIFRHPFGFTGTDAEIALYGADDPEREAAKKRIEHKRAQESAVWVGGRDFTSNTPSSKGYMGGIQEFLSTNVFSAFGTLSLTGFDAKLQQILQDGDMNKVIFAAPLPARALSHLFDARWAPPNNNDVLLGAKVNAFLDGAYGESIPVIVKREWGAMGTTGFGLGGALFVIDLGSVKRRPMRNRDTRLLPNRQGNGEDKVVFDYLTEMSFELKNESKHGAFYGITG